MTETKQNGLRTQPNMKRRGHVAASSHRSDAAVDLLELMRHLSQAVVKQRELQLILCVSARKSA
jgi:hypothetical protein